VILEDTSGTIRCTIFDDAVDAFWRVFNIGQVVLAAIDTYVKEYEISKGKVRKSTQPAVYEMSLTTQSSVLPCSQIPHTPTPITNNYSQGNIRPTFVPNPTFVGNLVGGGSVEVSPAESPRPAFEANASFQPRFESNLTFHPSFEANPAFQPSFEPKKKYT